MSEVKHTPGPWRIEERGRQANIFVRSDARHWALAEAFSTCGCSDPSLDVDEAETLANARLIAAAPEMFEALLNVRGILDTPVARRKHQNDPFYDGVVASIRAALSKATEPSNV